MTVIGIDDTDSRSLGMCTTYVAAMLAARIEREGGTVGRTRLVRLNPAIEHKTRGNAALAIDTDIEPARAASLTRAALDRAETDDQQTNPGAVIAPDSAVTVPQTVSSFAARAVHSRLDRETARERCQSAGYQMLTRGNGRGIVGALAAVGAWQAFEEWTWELIAYREREQWGTSRTVDRESVFTAANEWYPDVWDTVDREEGTAVCVPRTPCPVLYGIRGETPRAVRAVSDAIDSEPVSHRQLFQTNQGTDVHLRSTSALEDGSAYRVTGEIRSPPETREGGHVFCEFETDSERLSVAAFEPTKRFRDHVRNLRPGDRITACGELGDGTLKLEKFAVRELVRTELVTPDCPSCGRSMESAGRNAGYRCRDCQTRTDGKTTRQLDRQLETGWYEVPPCARRHVAKPLVRGGFDAPTHPER